LGRENDRSPPLTRVRWPVGKRRLGPSTSGSPKDETAGSSCIAEIRANEELANGKAATPFLRFGDRVRIEVIDERGRTIFGAIDQRLAKA
jgi:fumarylacetoacetate (FAA) hydrolase